VPFASAGSGRALDLDEPLAKLILLVRTDNRDDHEKGRGNVLASLVNVAVELLPVVRFHEFGGSVSTIAGDAVRQPARRQSPSDSSTATVGLGLPVVFDSRGPRPCCL